MTNHNIYFLGKIIFYFKYLLFFLNSFLFRFNDTFISVKLINDIIFLKGIQDVSIILKGGKNVLKIYLKSLEKYSVFNISLHRQKYFKNIVHSQFISFYILCCIISNKFTQLLNTFKCSICC